MKNRILLLFFLLAATVSAQQDLTSPMLRGSWQATFANPALLHDLDGRLTIGLPGIYNDLRIDNLTLADVLVEEDGRDVIDVSQSIDALEDRNELRDQLDVETIGIAWRNESWAFGLAHRLRYDGVINYPKTLAEVIWEGNAQFIGQAVDIRPDLHIGGYHEIGLSAAFKPTEQLSIGVRLKYLSGTDHVQSQDGGRLLLTTDEVAYALELDQDYVIHSAGALEYERAGDFDLNSDFAQLNFNKLFGSNSGLAFDVGAQLDLGRLRLQASVQDLGGTINWSDEVTNYRLEGVEAFEGLDILRDLLDGDATFDGAVDSLEEQFDPRRTSDEFDYNIPTRYLLGGELAVTDRLSVGALVYGQDGFSESELAGAISARYRLAEFLQLGAIYAYRQETFTNLGLHALVGIGPMRLLLATDNIVTAFRPKDAHQANVRVGLSLSFAREE